LYSCKNAIPLGYLACAAIFVAIAGCEPAAAPEEAVRQWVEEAQEAVEGRQRGVLADMIADSYADARGNDKSDIEQMLRIWFLRSSNIVLVATIDEVTVMGDSAATVFLTAGMATTSEGIFGLDADALHFKLELETTGDDWLLIGARWAELGGELH